MASLFFTRDVHVPAEIPRAGLVINAFLQMVTISVLAICFTRRLQATQGFAHIPVTRWLLFAIYVDSILFIVATAVLWNGFGTNLNQGVCSSAILLCLACYMTTKILIYYFLVEKVYIIRHKKTPRYKSKLYLFNCFGMLLPYCVVVVLNFYYRIAHFNKDGMCIIGMEKKAMMPLIIYDAGLNLYLTLLFVIPLRGLYSYKNSPNSAIRTIALRSFVGSLATLVSSLVNLTILMVLKGEPAWVCLMCCNADILFCVLVLHWVTSKDSSSSLTSARSGTATRNGTSRANKLGMPFPSASRQNTVNGTKNGDVGVTTHISAVGIGSGSGRAKDIEEEEEYVNDWRGDGTNKVRDLNSSGYPLGKIRVQVGHTVEVESEGGRSEVSVVQFGEDPSRRSNNSTEDLVERQRKFG